MKRIKFFCLLMLICGALCSCNLISQKPPRATVDKLIFDAKGGTQTVEVIVKRRPWRFVNLYATEADANGRVPIRETEKSLQEDGTTRIHYDWITCIVSKDTKSIAVTVEPNTTGKERSILFHGEGDKIGFVDFTVIQTP